MIYDIITIGGATRDITFFSNEGSLINNPKDLLRQKLLAFEQGAKIKVDKFHYLFGGGASNAAVNLAGSGFKVACLARVGRDSFGLDIKDNLKENGVFVPFLQKDEKMSSGFSFILVSPSGERIIFYNRSANENLKLIKSAIKAAGQAKWLYFASLPINWKKIVKPLFSLNQPKIAWNPGSAQYSGGLKSIAWFLKRTNLFMLNHDEAIELVLSDEKYKKRSHSFFNNVENLLPIIKNYGPEVVVITRGRKGADAYDGENFYHQDIFKRKKELDTTGVGDAFNSSLMAVYHLSNNNLKLALKIAAKQVSFKISNLGAQKGLCDLRKLLK
jgi:sugar/nucleoside kinase (ribokinase family)